MEAYVLIKTSGGTARKALKAIKKMKGVKIADGTYGVYDIIAKVEGDDVAGLVVDKIRAIDGVVDTNTLIVAL